jgi:hypothetical protein
LARHFRQTDYFAQDEETSLEPVELLAVPGVAESTLDDATVASLPAQAPPAPWDCTSAGIVWWGRASGVPSSSVAALLPDGGRPVVAIGGMISYASTPVGTYHEVFGGIGLRNGRGVDISIPFMAVDSRDSVVGGRQNWSLPKVLAQFRGEPAALAMTASGDGWTVRVSARPIAPRIPMRTNGRVLQRWPDGKVRAALLSGRAKSRLAIVTVAVESTGDLASWLRPGRHLGAVMSDVRFALPAAE